jgi:PAS domain-containing protein
MSEELDAIRVMLRPPAILKDDSTLDLTVRLLTREFSQQYAEDFRLQWLFLQHFPGEICVKDRESKMIWWNGSIARRSGVPLNTLFRSSTELLWPTSAGEWIRRMDRLTLAVNRCICHAEPQNPKAPAEEPFEVSLRFPLPIRGSDSGYIASIGLGFNDAYAAELAAAILGQVPATSRRVPLALRASIEESFSRDEQFHPKALFDLAELLDAFFANVPSESCVKSAESALLWSNQRYEELVGMRPERMRLAQPEKLWPGHQRSVRLRELDREVLSKEKPVAHPDERQTVPGRNVSGGRNLSAAVPLFPTVCAKVPGEVELR